MGRLREAFWEHVSKALLGSIILGLWRIVVDTDSRSLTLPKLRNEMREQTRDDNAKKLLDERLKRVKFEKHFKSVGRQLEELRNDHFAHLDVGAVDSAVQPAAVNLKILVDAAGHVAELLNAVGWDEALQRTFMTHHLEYAPGVERPGDDQRSDIERMLDEIAKESDNIKSPEEQPAAFALFWKRYPDAWKTSFNEYRRKFKLPAIAL